MVTKVVESVNLSVIRRILIDQIVIAIKQKWLEDGGPKTIFIQQENANVHITQQKPE